MAARPTTSPRVQLDGEPRCGCGQWRLRFRLTLAKRKPAPGTPAGKLRRRSLKLAKRRSSLLGPGQNRLPRAGRPISRAFETPGAAGRLAGRRPHPGGGTCPPFQPGRNLWAQKKQPTFRRLGKLICDWQAPRAGRGLPRTVWQAAARFDELHRSDRKPPAAGRKHVATGKKAAGLVLNPSAVRRWQPAPQRQRRARRREPPPSLRRPSSSWRSSFALRGRAG
jgi:hypothetical protein